MIISNKGSINVHGEMSDIWNELTHVILGVRNAMEKALTPEDAAMLITYAGRLAYADKGEEAKIIDEVRSIMEKAGKRAEKGSPLGG